MSEILKGMTREQALECMWSDGNGDGAFFYAGSVYTLPAEVFETGEKHRISHGLWLARINAYYDDLEKPKWVEPVMCKIPVPISSVPELFVGGWRIADNDKEIARTNARRKIEAFIRQNGGGRDLSKNGHVIGYRAETDKFEIASSIVGWMLSGAIYCATIKLAEAVIERYPAELRLLCEVTK